MDSAFAGGFERAGEVGYATLSRPSSALDDRQPDRLFDKIWNRHVIADLGEGMNLLHVDRHLLHDLSGPGSLLSLQRRGLNVRNPELTFASPDHCLATVPDRDEFSNDIGQRLIPILREQCLEQDIQLYDVNDPAQGIVHVIGPELGLTLPGTILVCGDSHTCTHGGVGALSFGIGSSELTHVLATQTIIERRPRTMRINFEGRVPAGVSPKDLILHTISKLGAGAGSGYAVEFGGQVLRNLSIEGRLTICNLCIEMGAKVGMVGPDETTYTYLADRPMAPKGELWDRAIQQWRSLPTHEEATFDWEERFDCSEISPQISWGTSPAHSIGVDESIPDPRDAGDASSRKAWQDALTYMDLSPGRMMTGLKIDHVFIGSCTNGRISDLQAAAEIVSGNHVHSSVEAWVIPGSMRVKKEAEEQGLHRVFADAGFQWRQPGCSICSATNGESVRPRHRCISTSNRNFMGRQGPDARTHLASPAMAAAAAIEGCVVDVRKWQQTHG